MSTTNNEQNDWENEDDWDDWGDAVDNFENETDAKKNNNEKLRQNPTENKKDGNSNENNTEKESPREENHKSSWASMLKPFGGVVSTITSSVSHGINQVIGVPNPEELARINVAEAAKAKEMEPTEHQEERIRKESTTTPTTANPIFGLDLSGVTTLGSKVLNTGLDTLEGIGKKTMNILQENDPLLMNKRKLLGMEAERPNLSAVLKEAKNDADQLEKTMEQLKIEKTKSMLHFEYLFENNCGLVHLEALEILSRESTLKLEKLKEAIVGQALVELKETINEVKELMELEDLEGESDGDYNAAELNEQLTTAIADVEIQINFNDIESLWSETLNWLENEDAQTERSAEQLFAKGITVQAETCALEMNKLHKIAELLLVKEHHSTANEVDGIVQLCKQFTIHLVGLTNRFAAALTTFKGDETAKTLTNALFSEMLLATQQIEKAFKLFLPILQFGAV